MTEAQRPDAMKKLVLVIIARAAHFGMEQPAQQAPQAPKNWDNPAQRCCTCQEYCI